MIHPPDPLIFYPNRTSRFIPADGSHSYIVENFPKNCRFCPTMNEGVIFQTIKEKTNPDIRPEPDAFSGDPLSVKDDTDNPPTSVLFIRHKETYRKIDNQMSSVVGPPLSLFMYVICRVTLLFRFNTMKYEVILQSRIFVSLNFTKKSTLNCSRL